MPTVWWPGALSPSESFKFTGADVELAAPPGTSAPVPDPYPDGPRSSRFLLGDGFGLRPALEERGLSSSVSSTQFEQGVTAGGLRRAFRWSSKFDMLAHLLPEWSGVRT